jgi:regulator of protease activity HflC (stomatin/prohibitin superfamily)
MGVVGLVLALVAVYVLAMLSGFHEVKEGYVGIYKKLGVLQPKLSEPGFHFRIPMYEQFIEMKISIQTDVVTNIPCGTSNGTLVYFDKVEIVNKLRKEYVYETVLNYTEDYERFWITDKLHHEINQFCSKHSLQEIYISIFDKLDEELIKSLNKDLPTWAPGIEILSIRVTKPNIPDRIKRNFEEMEKIKVDFFIAAEKEKVKVEEEMTKQRQQVIKAESNLEVKKIDLKKMIEKKENDLKMAKIEGEMIFEKAKTQIETEFLAAFEEAENYHILFTDSYMSYLTTDALTSNANFVLGDEIPNIQLKQ